MNDAPDFEHWRYRLERSRESGEAPHGYHLLYGPWNRITTARVAFISANPGARRDDGRDLMVSDERGNSYEVEASTTLSPLTAQFLEMCIRNGWRPADVLTSVANPFRTPSESDLTPVQKRAGRKCAADFWRACFVLGNIRTIVACSNSARDLVVELTGANAADAFPSGWGTTSIRLYDFAGGGRIIHLPHLSTFKLFSRDACREPLRRAFEGVAS